MAPKHIWLIPPSRRLLGAEPQPFSAVRYVAQVCIAQPILERCRITHTLSVRVYAQLPSRCHHLRTRNGDHEVDIVVQRADGCIVALEVRSRHG